MYRFKLGIYYKNLEPIKHRQQRGLGEVEQYTKDGEFVAKYRTSSEAEKITGIAGPCIRNCIHGKANTAGGYIWKLAN